MVRHEVRGDQERDLLELLNDGLDLLEDLADFRAVHDAGGSGRFSIPVLAAHVAPAKPCCWLTAAVYHGGSLQLLPVRDAEPKNDGNCKSDVQANQTLMCLAGYF